MYVYDRKKGLCELYVLLKCKHQAKVFQVTTSKQHNTLSINLSESFI